MWLCGQELGMLDQFRQGARVAGSVARAVTCLDPVIRGRYPGARMDGFKRTWILVGDPEVPIPATTKKKVREWSRCPSTSRYGGVSARAPAIGHKWTHSTFLQGRKGSSASFHTGLQHRVGKKLQRVHSSVQLS